MRLHHMTDSSHQSFHKLKSVTLTLKTGLGGVQNELVPSLGFCIPCFFFIHKGLLKSRLKSRLKKDANDSDNDDSDSNGETDIEDCVFVLLLYMFLFHKYEIYGEVNIQLFQIHARLSLYFAHGSWDMWKQTTQFIVDSYHYINQHTTDYLCRTWCNPAPEWFSTKCYFSRI
jgi:hypothetical protein